MASDKIYKYYFAGIAEPLEIQASNRRSAREALIRYMPDTEERYRKSRKVIGETVTKLLIGISSRIDHRGVKMVWVGLKMSPDGWKSEKELESEAEKYEARQKIVQIKENGR